jgi:hypothetical protein
MSEHDPRLLPLDLKGMGIDRTYALPKYASLRGWVLGSGIGTTGARRWYALHEKYGYYQGARTGGGFWTKREALDAIRVAAKEEMA